MSKIRRSRGRLIFNMGMPPPGKDGLYIEMGFCFCYRYCFQSSVWHASINVNVTSVHQTSSIRPVSMVSTASQSNGDDKICFNGEKCVKAQNVNWVCLRGVTTNCYSKIVFVCACVSWWCYDTDTPSAWLASCKRKRPGMVVLFSKWTSYVDVC